jgi:hypothetical protein
LKKALQTWFKKRVVYNALLSAGLLMNTSAINKSTIIRELSRIPDNSLEQVKTYIDSLLMELHASPLENRSLKGIWKDAGFEKISDLEGELRTVRKQLQESILKRTF